MKLFPFHPSKFGIFLSLCVLVAACKASKPTRKTLPDYIYGEPAGRSGAGSDGQADLPFYAIDTLIKGQNFTAIYLLNSEFDSLAFNLVELYKPFAKSVMKMIENQNIKGVVLDFRRNADQQFSQANFQVAEAGQAGQGVGGTTGLELIFLWDENSGARATEFMEQLKNIPRLDAMNTARIEQSSPVLHQDCFKPATPDFNQP